LGGDQVYPHFNFQSIQPWGDKDSSKKKRRKECNLCKAVSVVGTRLFRKMRGRKVMIIEARRAVGTYIVQENPESERARS